MSQSPDPSPQPAQPPVRYQQGGYPAQVPDQQGGYPAPGPYIPVVVQRGTNGLAIASLVMALCGLAVLPVVFGHIALRQIKNRDEGGAALAIVGLVLGYGQIALYVILMVAIGGGIWASLAS